MIRASTKPLRRVVYGGTALGDLVVEILHDRVALRPKGKRTRHGVVLTWATVFRMAEERKDKTRQLIRAVGGAGK